jgi:hypothetical protein
LLRNAVVAGLIRILIAAREDRGLIDAYLEA